MDISDNSIEIINQLRESNISKLMKSLEASDWLVYEKKNNRIIGAAGIGGIFHTSSIFIDESLRGKGYGKKIQQGVINEAKKRHYSFVTVFVDPRNTSSIKLHDELGYQNIFRIHYSKKIVQDIKIIVFRKKGYLVRTLLGFFNTKIGNLFLVCMLKIFRGYFKTIFAYDENEIPSLDFKISIKNFEKI
tara:strand:+ start:618 stop:1184 length:567 start_codon:yes stop_codon:yes gene_type:complete